MTKNVWIDIVTGTFGVVDDLRIIGQIDDRAADVLDRMSDEERRQFGLKRGKKVEQKDEA